MIWIKKITRPLLLVVLPVVVIACTVSYKFNGSSINYDKVKTISLPTSRLSRSTYMLRWRRSSMKT